MGKIRLGLIFVGLIAISSVAALLAISAVSTHFAYASAKTVPIPPKRPNVMSASPAYIRQLMATREGRSDVYDDAFSYDSSFDSYEEDYKKEKIASLSDDIDPQLLSETLDSEDSIEDYNFDKIVYLSEISESGIPIPGRKPSYGAGSMVQRVEDFSNNPSSIELAFIEPKAGGHYSDAQTLNEDYETTDASGAVRQPIVNSSQKENEKALVSFMLNPKQVALDTNLKRFLLDHAVEQFKSDPNLRLEIHAYASIENEQEYSDVRRSLARALEVRSFLLEQNIDPSRLKITPIGQDIDNTADDRIDLLFIVSKK